MTGGATMAAGERESCATLCMLRGKESRLPLVTKLPGVNEHLGIAESARIAPREKAVGDDVADEQNNRSANDPALHGPLQ